MRLTHVRAAALLFLLLCLACAGCFRSYDAAPGARGVVSVEPSPQNENAQQVKSPLPPPEGFVNDYAGVFDGESKASMESFLSELRDKAEIEFALVTIETTEGRPISDYSLDVAKGWGVGAKDTSKGGGLILLLATKDHEWRLQVSRGLEKDLPDDECKRLGDESAELYRKGLYAEGLTKYVNALVSKLEEARGFKLSRRPGGK